MATKVYMEALSPTMEEGRLITWLKKEGDQVDEGDVLAEVETDKATMELVARGSGVLRKALIGDGDTANVGSVIAVIAGADEDVSGLVGEATEVEQGPTSGVTAEDLPDDAEGDVAEAAASLARSEHTERDQAKRGSPERAEGDRTPTPTPDRKTQAGAGGAGRSATPSGGAAQEGDAAGAAGTGNGRVKASPLARRLAAEAGVEIGDVQGSGPGGRIVKRDVESAMQGTPAGAGTGAGGRDAAAAPTEETRAPAAQPAPAGAAAEYREIPLSQMRKTIARRLSQSIGPVPHFFLTMEVDMSETARLRERLNQRYSKEGVKVSVNDMIVKAVAMALKRHPWVNAAWTGESIRLYDVVHIGVAVAVEEGLITPVVRNADRKGVVEIGQEVREMAGRAREKKLKPEEYTGGTFSISNLGMFGIEEFTAVINPPEAAILAVGTVEEKVVVEDGEMMVRPRMRVTLSCDHRVIDGATGAQFLQTLKGYLEEPMLMIA